MLRTLVAPAALHVFSAIHRVERPVTYFLSRSHFDLIAQELARQQREVKEIEDADLLNAETLPRALQELRIPCAQKDIDGLLKILASRRIVTVGDLRKLVDQDAVTVIRETWRTATDKEEATNFDIISTLVSAPGIKGEREWATAARVQLAIKESSGRRGP